ncbi:AlwI family type II restriction endonuclease [Clostridium perfringens]
MINILNYYDKILDRNHISPSSYFEWNTYRAFNALGGFIKITPNFKIDNDGKPAGDAKPGVADIIINYDKIDLILECSLRSGVSQVDYEGNSVYRHSVDLKKSSKKMCLTLFISPNIHDELYEYYADHSNVTIIPLTLSQFKKLIVSVKNKDIEEYLLTIKKNLSYDNFESYDNWKLAIDNYINDL